jgi:nucleotide-binding universal stress UspA family protein
MAGRGIEKIVVGVDGSEQSAAAIEWAIRMAQGMGSEVVAVFAIDVPHWFAEPYVTAPPPQFDPEWRKEMQTAFEELWCKPLRDAAVKYQAIMEDGRPASVINRIAEGMAADLIILGRRGRGGVAELVLGSVSHELVLHARLPVLLIPHREDGAVSQ